VIVDHRLPKPTRFAVQHEMLIVAPALAARFPSAEKSHVPFRVQTTMLEHSVEETDLSRNQEAVHIFRECTLQRVDLVYECVGQVFVGIKMQLPSMPERKMVDCPVPLRPVVLKWMLNDLDWERTENLQRFVSTEGVYRMNIVGHSRSALHGTRNRAFRVERKYHY
jgi:hypothetical protein